MTVIIIANSSRKNKVCVSKYQMDKTLKIYRYWRMTNKLATLPQLTLSHTHSSAQHTRTHIHSISQRWAHQDARIFQLICMCICTYVYARALMCCYIAGVRGLHTFVCKFSMQIVLLWQEKKPFKWAKSSQNDSLQPFWKFILVIATLLAIWA